MHGHLPRGTESVAELYSYLLQDYLPARYPTMFKLSPDGNMFENTVTGASFPVQPPQDPNLALRSLGETVEEDLFLLHGTPDGHLCVAFMCCFPSGFDPSEKFGNLLKDIHGPVPSYSKIGASMERFFGKLQVGGSVKRLNVGVFLSPPDKISNVFLENQMLILLFPSGPSKRTTIYTRWGRTSKTTSWTFPQMAALMSTRYVLLASCTPRSGFPPERTDMFVADILPR